MSRYIDADKFISQLEDQYMEHDLTREKYMDLEDRINQQPTADVAPVRKGKWIKLYQGNYKCSVCGDWWVDDDNGRIKEFRFCPNCGASMTEGAEDV